MHTFKDIIIIIIIIISGYCKYFTEYIVRDLDGLL